VSAHEVEVKAGGPSYGGAVNDFLAGEREPLDEILEHGAVRSEEGRATLAEVAPRHGLTADDLERAVVASIRLVRAREELAVWGRLKAQGLVR